ncbi:hypothetical protein QBC46DRAFT_268988 [Diplogelasinospora grovesii]|uniref:Uncharacterized protein n=1 Tax=Diplogelasinospora grovesii TaxID=303347 RepID=A0AAN6N3L0_9PEZI|nr:hypothetical protein QBC46DRAFT_268988 [Diplogelasinospora grovesii]
MVIGLLVIAGIPTTIGVCEALSAQKKADNAAKEKAKFHLTTTVSLDGKQPVECWCVLRAGMLWVDHPAFPMPGHKFTGYYFTYPSEAQHRGLVSTIADDPPMLNWIFVDKDSPHLLRHGGRQETLGDHTIGPWYWSDDEQWLTLEGDDEQFVTVPVEVGGGVTKWAVAWDRDGSIRFGGEESSSETEETEEDEDKDEDENEETSSDRQRSRKPPKWVSSKLRRKLQLGMESRYVKGEKADK